MADRIVRTPGLNNKGLYNVASPFTLVANTLYVCKEIRSFQGLIAAGVDVQTTYYTSMGLTAQDYTDDLNAGANIITLMSNTAPTVYVPDTFISTFPSMGDVPYSTVIIDLSLGPLPETLDLTALQTALGDTASDLIGIVPTVDVMTISSTSVMSQTDADTAEAARQGAIKTRTTSYAKLVTLEAENTQLLATNQALQALLAKKATN